MRNPDCGRSSSRPSAWSIAFKGSQTIIARRPSRIHRQQRVLLAALALAFGSLSLLSPARATAQAVAVIKSHDIEPFNKALAGFVSACPDPITEYNLGGSDRGKKEIVQKIIAGKPRFVLAIGALAARVAKEEIRNIPVIFVMVPNPRKHSLEAQNIAGIALDIPVERQFATYKSLAPSIRTIGVIYDPEKTGATVAEAGRVADKLGLKLIATPVSSHKQVPAALRGMLGKIDALWMVADDTVVTPESFKFLSLTAFEHNLPLITVSEIFVEVGALASLSPDYGDIGRQACQLLTEIASGRLSLAGVNIIFPAKVNLAVNLNTALKIGLTLSPEIMKTASKVYR
ncbi:MAG: hypothetical protein HY726_20845 [Candidatus Rokubacteria bacterium]|nr:hypothetical protein [Candidatus Rokubacteria bacterium]